jgi:iron complex outermembrane receptor protein
VRSYGPGGLASVAIRGSTAGQTKILVDGLSLQDPQLGQIDLSLLPIAMFGSAEVMFGGSSALYGSDGVGGVVRLSTMRADAPIVSLHVGAGPYGIREQSVRTQVPLGRLAASLFVDHQRSDGDFRFLDQTLFPARTVRRSNADYRRTNVALTLVETTAEIRRQVSAWYSGADRGLPGHVGSTPVGERQVDHQFRIWGQQQGRMRGGTYSVKASARRASLRYLNPHLDIDDTGKTTLATAEASDTDLLHSSTSHTGKLESGTSHSGTRDGVRGAAYYELGSSLEYARASHPSLASPEDGPADEWRTATFVSGAVELGRVLLYPSVRADLIALARGRTLLAPTARLGANVVLVRDVRLRATGGRVFRAPTINDRFWRSEGARGNRSLSAEDGWTFDGGLVGVLTNSLVEVSLFSHHMRNQIVWERGTDGVWTPINVGRTMSRGAEVAYRLSMPLGAATLTNSGNYGFTSAVDRSERTSPTFGKQLRMVPRHTGGARIELRTKVVNAGIDVQAAGRRYVTADESTALKPFAAVDFELSTSVRAGSATIRGAVTMHNVLDAQYEVISGYPIPPRYVTARAVVTINRKQ